MAIDPVCDRSITFTIPGKPGVQVTATESGDGKINFVVDVLNTSSITGDLRGLFFNVVDDGKLAGLTATGPKVTELATGSVIDLGNGSNMQGAALPFDVGVEFGTQGIGKGDDLSDPLSFTLSNAANNLTLDDIAHVQFGARVTSIGDPAKVKSRVDSEKIVTLSPAAPNAVDDSYKIFEDGQSGLNSPSHTPAATVFKLLANDTDADGDTLTITEVHDHGDMHGTVTIVDGDDADSLPGDAVAYTPDADYAGPASFEYCISDGHGGTDFAFVNVGIEAVADVPDLKYEITAGDDVNKINVKVTATQTDADKSEFIDRIELSGVPSGVSVTPNGVNPGTEPDQIVQNFLLTLPTDQDTNFNLGIKAVSKEESNGDEETNSVSVPIVMEVNTITEDKTFYAKDQSIWTTGDKYVFDDERFIGINVPEKTETWGGPAPGSLTYAFKAGFDSDLHFEGGDIDAQIPWQFNFKTLFNKTTDALRVDPSDTLTAGGNFLTDGPSLQYGLDFILNYKLAYDLNYDIAGVTGDISSNTWTGNHTQNIINYDSETSAPVNINLWNNALTATLAWPNLQVAGTETSPASGVYDGNGASNNAFNLNLDVDQALANLFFGGANPFDISVEVDILGVGGGVSAEIIDADVAAGLNFLQDFKLTAGSIDATLNLEDGSSVPVNFGSPISFANASAIDAAGNNDGIVEGIINMDLVGSTLKNDTNLGLNVGWNFDILKGTWWYNAVVDSDSGTWGPVVDLGQNMIPVWDTNIFSAIVGVNFGPDSMGLSA